MGKKSIRDLRQRLRRHRGGRRRQTLAPDFYTSADWLEFEIEDLLRREWLCLGRADEIANPGDYLALDILGEPLLAVRGRDHELRVLANVCRHRNMPVAEGAGNTRLFVCPYHAWSYGLDGSLLNTPHVDDVDRQGCALPVYRSEVWQGFLFVNLDGEADALAPRLAGLDQILGNYHSDRMHQVFVEDEIWDSNWKGLVENFLEGYHLSRVHPDTLGGRTPTRLAEKFAGGDGYTGYRSFYPDGAPERGSHHPDLTEIERGCSTLFCVYPCLVASQASDVLVYMSLQPAGVDRVRVRWGMSVYDEALPAAERDARVELWRNINAEDKRILSRIQRVLGSRHAVAGPLAPDDYEGTIRDFHAYLAARLAAA